jgi:hypothetical protein
LRVEVIKCNDVFIAINDLGGNLTFNNLAEDALGI